MTLNLASRLAPFSLIIAITVGILTSSCAYKVAPTGGPRDSIAAAITAVEPPSGTTSFSSKTVRMVFDDYVDRGIRNSITVLPTKRFNTSYAGDEITVEFREPLDSSTTYTITLGTDWTDTRGNRPAEAYTYVFATGTTIDSGYIHGRIVAASLQNVVVSCYPHADTLKPGFSPRTQKAPYIIPIGTTGSFAVRGLADGLYRVIVFRDENKNALIDANEEFTTTPRDVQIQRGQSEYLQLRLGKPIDHEPPQLVRARPLTSSLLQLQFTERVFPVSTWAGSITLHTTDGTEVPSSVQWTPASTPDVVLVRFAKPLDSTTYELHVAPSSLRDSAGVRLADTIVTKSITWTSKPDTTTLRVVAISPPDSAKDVAVDTTISLTFSDAVDTNDTRVSIWHETSQGAIPVATRWISPTMLELIAQRPRIPKAMYTTTVVIDRLTSAIGSELKADTIMHHMSTAARKNDPGTVKGRIDTLPQSPAGVASIIRLLTPQGNVAATGNVDAHGEFIIAAAPPGEYSVDVFYDTNGNGQFDCGDTSPFMFSEPWWPSTQRITVRSRWTIEDVVIVIGMK